MSKDTRKFRHAKQQEIPVFQLDKKTGEIYARFPSMKSAVIYLFGEYKKNKVGKISLACKGERKSAYGYAWKYESDYYKGL